MRYIFLLYRGESIITIEEYVREVQPAIYIQLVKFMKTKKDITEKVLAAADISRGDRFYKSIMEERPKGGRGGLLPWEREEDLY